MKQVSAASGPSSGELGRLTDESGRWSVLLPSAYKSTAHAQLRSREVRKNSVAQSPDIIGQGDIVRLRSPDVVEDALHDGNIRSMSKLNNHWLKTDSLKTENFEA